MIIVIARDNLLTYHVSIHVMRNILSMNIPSLYLSHNLIWMNRSTFFQWMGITLHVLILPRIHLSHGRRQINSMIVITNFSLFFLSDTVIISTHVFVSLWFKRFFLYETNNFESNTLYRKYKLLSTFIEKYSWVRRQNFTIFDQFDK